MLLNYGKPCVIVFGVKGTPLRGRFICFALPGRSCRRGWGRNRFEWWVQWSDDFPFPISGLCCCSTVSRVSLSLESKARLWEVALSAWPCQEDHAEEDEEETDSSDESNEVSPAEANGWQDGFRSLNEETACVTWYSFSAPAHLSRVSFFQWQH